MSELSRKMNSELEFIGELLNNFSKKYNCRMEFKEGIFRNLEGERFYRYKVRAIKHHRDYNSKTITLYTTTFY